MGAEGTGAVVGGPVPECQESGRQEVGGSLSFVKAEEEEAVSGPSGSAERMKIEV